MTFIRETLFGDLLCVLGLLQRQEPHRKPQANSTKLVVSETASDSSVEKYICNYVGPTHVPDIQDEKPGAVEVIVREEPGILRLSHTVVTWEGGADPTHPRNWPRGKKLWVTFVICYYTFVVYTASAIFVPSFAWVMVHHGVSQTMANLGLAMYVLGYGLGPLLFSPISEIYYVGRNAPYLISYVCFITMAITTAVVAEKSFTALIICRFLQGYFGSPILASGGASVEDIWDWFAVPYAFIFWIGSMYSGPALGPLFAAYTVTEDWKWPLWEIAIIAAPLAIMLILLPETYPAKILYSKARLRRAADGAGSHRTADELDTLDTFSIVRQAITTPFAIGRKDPAIRFVSMYGSLIYAIYYSFFEAFPVVYVGIYQMPLSAVCTVFLSVVAACAAFGGVYAVYLYTIFLPKCRRQEMSQESRLLPALPTSFLAPIGLLIFGWTARTSVHWLVPTTGVFIYAGTSFVLFQCIMCYVALSYPRYVASLIACNFFFRSIWACGFIMFSHPMYSELGVGKGVSILGSLSILGIVGVWYLYYNGGRMRARSTFAAS